MEFITKRLRLRPVGLNDKEEIFNYRSDTVTNKYQGWIPKTVSDVETFIRKCPKEINIPDSWYQFSIILLENEKLIGDLGIHFIGDMQAEIGCTLDKRFHSQGYATEALKSVIDYLFNDLKKHRITSSLDPRNTGSLKLIERLGFRKEGHFIESYYHDGEWLDDLVYSILRREWNHKT